MESVSNTNRKLIKHFRKVDEPFYGWTAMKSDQIYDVIARHHKRPTNMNAWSWDKEQEYEDYLRRKEKRDLRVKVHE